MSSKILNYPPASRTTCAHSTYVNNPSSAVVSSAVTSSCSLNYDNLQLDDILCPVCTSVLIEPVYLPCQHLLCRNCLNETIKKDKLNCPCCRKRFGTWYRNASRGNKLVHERLWQAIQSQFRDRLADEGVPGFVKESAISPSLPSKPCYIPVTQASIKLAKPGEIRKDFSNELKRYQQQRQADATKELAATEQCIINLYKQEGIVDLADNSSHVSVSSATTPDLQDGGGCEKSTHVITLSPMAGPSSLCYARRQIPTKPQTVKGGVQKPSVIVGSLRSKSPSNASVISISSTSSAASAVTASSSASSSASGRYSLLKPVAQHVGRSAELRKSKVQDTMLHRLTAGKLQLHQKSLGSFDLNKSEHCIKPTALHKIEPRGLEDAGDTDVVDDTDSLKSEQNHFIPIIASLPKSSFSLDKVVRVLPVRPMYSPVKYNLTPKKNTCRLQKATIMNQSAFSVVTLDPFASLKTPPQEDSEKASASSSTSSRKGAKRNKSAKSNTPRRGSRRRIKLKSTPLKVRKTATQVLCPASTAGAGASTRITRRTIVETIINDQQRREQRIEMERRDFEFAQKLQEKLNRTCGIMQEIYRQAVPRSTGYSLRRKGTGNCTQNVTLNSNCIHSGAGLNSSASSLREENVSSKTPPNKTRKRKATSSSVENDVPSSSSPTKQVADFTKPRQTRQSRPNKLNNVNLLVDASSTAVEQQSLPRRKSARNKAR